MIGGLLRILVISLILLVAAMMLMPRVRQSVPQLEAALMLDAPRPLPAVSFTRHTGEAFTLDDLDSRHALLFFGFTNCPDICPLTLQVLALALEEIRAEYPVIEPAVIFVSVDPKRDTTERIAAYVRAFDSEIIGLTATEEALAPLIAAFGVIVHQQAEEDGLYNVVHNASVFLLDEAGQWIGLFSGSSHQVAEIVHDYVLIRERQSAN